MYSGLCLDGDQITETEWKPGSTLIVVFPTWAPYVIHKSRDELGRWCSVTLQVKERRQISFYSFYNCCKTRIEQSGIHTIYAQQWHVLRQRGNTSPDPRIQAIQDLGKELAEHRAQRRSICIVGNFNEAIGQEPALFASLCGQYALVDIMDSLHPAHASVSSYARGSTRLDYILVTPDLLSYVDTAGLNHYHEFYPSDHRPLFVGLDASLFGPLPPMTHHKSRYVHSNSKTVGPFIEAAYQHLVDTGTFPKLNFFLADIATLSDSEISQTANSIDDQITKALLSAERKCKRPHKEPWSDQVHFASLHVKYWRLKRAATANVYDAQSTLTAINMLLPASQKVVDAGDTTDQQALNAANRHLASQRRDAHKLRKVFLQALRERIAMRKSSTTLSPAEALKCIDKQLRQTAQYGHIKSTLKPTASASLTKVHVTTRVPVTDPDTAVVSHVPHVTVVDTKEELELRILARNKLHFAQAEGTPFTEAPLKGLTPNDALDSFSDPDGARLRLLAGTFAETHSVMAILKDAFLDRPPLISPTISFEDFVTSLLHWDEKTSTSPSEQHLGLYKSILTAPY
jgi:hypothetical protein